MRQIVSSEEAQEAEGQHRRPCSDCPWARSAFPGWLGSATADDWIATAHSDERIDCHTLLGAQCAGAATYRANVCKSPRDKSLLVLPADRVRVFSSPEEFRTYHRSIGWEATK